MDTQARKYDYEHVEGEDLTGPNGEPNYYDPTPTDAEYQKPAPEGTIPQWVLDLNLGNGEDNEIVEVTPEYLKKVRGSFALLVEAEEKGERR